MGLEDSQGRSKGWIDAISLISGQSHLTSNANRLSTLALFLDLSKAFDTIIISVLLRKLC